VPLTDVRKLPGPLSAVSRSASQDRWCAGSGLCWGIATRMFQGLAVSGRLNDRGRLTEWQCYHNGERQKTEGLAEQLLVLFEQDRTVSAVVVLEVSDFGTVVGVM